jgi:hypothetical protein
MIRINSSRFCFILSPEAAAFQAGKGQRSSTKEQLPKAIPISRPPFGSSLDGLAEQ